MKKCGKIVLLLIISVILCGCNVGELSKNFSKGLTKEQQAEVDATVADYTERIQGITWRNVENAEMSLKFHEDGTVEENGRFSEPGSWEIRFGGEYDNSLPVAEMTKKQIEEWCDYYLRYDQPEGLSGYDRQHLVVHFDEDGNLVLGKYTPATYIPSIDTIYEMPEDAYQDEFFYGNFPANDWGVWVRINEETGDEGELWIIQPDGKGAETVGAMAGELIYPDYFQWAYKDDHLYIQWARTEEYIAENGQDLDVYVIEKGDGEFWATPYLDFEGKKKVHYRQTKKLDIYSW